MEKENGGRHVKLQHCILWLINSCFLPRWTLNKHENSVVDSISNCYFLNWTSPWEFMRSLESHWNLCCKSCNFVVSKLGKSHKYNLRLRSERKHFGCVVWRRTWHRLFLLAHFEQFLISLFSEILTLVITPVRHYSTHKLMSEWELSCETIFFWELAAMWLMFLCMPSWVTMCQLSCPVLLFILVE